jgi:hypothetical protein
VRGQRALAEPVLPALATWRTCTTHQLA